MNHRKMCEDHSDECSYTKLKNNKDYKIFEETEIKFYELISELEVDYFNGKKYKHLDVYDENVEYYFKVDMEIAEETYRDRKIFGAFLEPYNEDLIKGYECDCYVSENNKKEKRIMDYYSLGLSVDYKREMLKELIEKHGQVFTDPEKYINTGLELYDELRGPFLEQYNDDLVSYIFYECKNGYFIDYYKKKFNNNCHLCWSLFQK